MISASEMRLNNEAATPITAGEILNIVSVADLKRQSRRLDSSEDTRFQESIEDAYYYLDGPNGYLNRAILSQQWVGFLDEFDDCIEVPLPPLVTVDLVRYRDTAGTWQTLATSVYGVRTAGLFGEIYLKADQSWPGLHDDPGSVEITFTAGMTDGAAVIAAGSKLRGVRKAMLLLAGHYFHNPLPTYPEPRLVEVPRTVQWGLTNVLGRIRIVNDHS